MLVIGCIFLCLLVSCGTQEVARNKDKLWLDFSCHSFYGEKNNDINDKDHGIGYVKYAQDYCIKKGPNHTCWENCVLYMHSIVYYDASVMEEPEMVEYFGRLFGEVSPGVPSPSAKIVAKRITDDCLHWDTKVPNGWNCEKREGFFKCVENAICPKK